MDLDSLSILLIWTAIAIYALAFVAYAIDLARRSASAIEEKDAASDAVRTEAARALASDARYGADAKRVLEEQLHGPGLSPDRQIEIADALPGPSEKL